MLYSISLCAVNTWLLSDFYGATFGSVFFELLVSSILITDTKKIAHFTHNGFISCHQNFNLVDAIPGGLLVLAQLVFVWNGVEFNLDVYDLSAVQSDVSNEMSFGQ